MIALAAGDRAARLLLDAALENGDLVLLPTIVLAETTRGSARDATVNRLANDVKEFVDLDESLARRAGQLLAAAQSDATIDAVIVATAERQGGGIVMTSDRTDMPRLAANATGVRLAFV